MATDLEKIASAPNAPTPEETLRHMINEGECPPNLSTVVRDFLKGKEDIPKILGREKADPGANDYFARDEALLNCQLFFRSHPLLNQIFNIENSNLTKIPKQEYGTLENTSF